MIQKLKNWLIKKLGGYTKAEYDGKYIEPPEFTVQVKSIEELHSQTPVPFVGSVPDYEAAKRSIIRGISKILEPYIVFKEKPGYYADSVLHGCLTVVTPGEDR